jgi:hypothetical protein
MHFIQPAIDKASVVIAVSQAAWLASRGHCIQPLREHPPVAARADTRLASRTTGMGGEHK